MYCTFPQCCGSQQNILLHSDLTAIKNIKDTAFEITVRLVRVYDGDTIWVAYYDKNLKKVMKISCRLSGYDAPEMKPSKDTPQRDLIIENAHKAKEIAEQHFNKHLFKIKVLGNDKYGRWLVEDTILKNKLLNKNLAYLYEGGTKKTFHLHL